MNLAALFPWELYAIRQADGLTLHSLSRDGTVPALFAAGVERVLLVGDRPTSVQSFAWSRLRAALVDAGMEVDEVPLASWRMHLRAQEYDPNSFLTIDEARIDLVQRLIAYCGCDR